MISNAGLDPSITVIRVDLVKKPNGSVTCATIANYIDSNAHVLPDNKEKGCAIISLKSGSSKTRDADGNVKFIF